VVCFHPQKRRGWKGTNSLWGQGKFKEDRAKRSMLLADLEGVSIANLRKKKKKPRHLVAEHSEIPGTRSSLPLLVRAEEDEASHSKIRGGNIKRNVFRGR